MKNAFKNKAMPLAAHLYNLPHSDEEFLSRLDAIILANISNPNFSNEQLAEAFCLSKSTLNRKIKGQDIEPMYSYDPELQKEAEENVKKGMD